MRVQVDVRWMTDYCLDQCSGGGSESALWDVLRTNYMENGVKFDSVFIINLIV
jgi:hypothetical protein